MRGWTLLLSVAVCGCQIIINHNNFEPASDAGADSGIDSPPPNFTGTLATSNATMAVLLITAHVTWQAGNPTFVGDHAGFTTLNKNGKNDVTFGFDANLFSTNAECICKSRGSGSDRHDCVLAYSRQTDAEWVVWSNNSSPDYDVDLVCVGGTTSGTANQLVTNEPLLVAGARLAVGTAISTQTGTWLDSVGGTGDAAFVNMVPEAPFASAPNCVTTSMPSGNHNGRMVTTTQTKLTGNAWGTAPDFVSMMCLGSTSSSTTVTPEPAGLMIASVRLPNQDNALDGGWVASTPPQHVGSGVFRITPDASISPHFTGEPYCQCTPVIGDPPTDTRHLSCQLTSIPSAGQIEVRLFDETTGTVVDPTGVTSMHVICAGRR